MSHKVILGLVALVLILFSLVVSLVVPKRDAGFPGRSLKLLVLVSALLVAGMLASVELVGGEEEAAGAEATVVTGGEGQGGTESTPSTATEGTGAETGGAAPAGDPQAGAAVFKSAGCVSCHTLKAAGATGTVGPNLDEKKPPYDLVIERVTNGKAPMPSFKDQLSEKQIQDVAAYVVASTQG